MHSMCLIKNMHDSPLPLSTPSPPPGWCQRLVHSPAESCVCLAAAAVVAKWQFSSPLESNRETPSRSRGPGGGKLDLHSVIYSTVYMIQ